MNYDRRKSELRKITGVGVMFMAVTLVISVMLNGEANTGNTMIWAKDESNVQTVSDSENKNPDEIFDINTQGEETEGEKISAGTYQKLKKCGIRIESTGTRAYCIQKR